MKKLLLFGLLLLTVQAFSQQDAWVYFSDKPNAANYFANPLLMLSQRALDRRAIQNIPLDLKDIPVNASYISQVNAVPGIALLAKSRWQNAVHVRGSFENIQSIMDLPFVSQIDFADKTIPTLSARTAQTNHNASSQKTDDAQVTFGYGNSANQIQMLHGQTLHQQDYTGAGKIIAVLDAGFPGVNTAQPFQRLYANNLILGGYNYVARSNDFYTGGTHGTMVLSTMGGYTENQLVGTAPDAAYYLFITEDIGSENPVEESLWVEAAEKADSLGVDVINSSLGYFTYDNPNYSYTYQDANGATSFISRGADIAFSRGMVVVVSAGNSGAGSEPHIGVPADGTKVLTVGAVNAASQYAAFSSIGPTTDGRIKPDVMAQGQAAALSDTSGNIVTANGTSFSSPIMAGMVACLWQALPQKTNAEIVQLIKASSSFYNAPNAQHGYGIPNFSQALASGLGVPDVEKPYFILYPNPADAALKISFPDNFKNTKLSVYNELGQLLLQKDNLVSGQTISVENWASGVYFYKIASANASQTGKLLKK